ncbi:MULTISPECIES: DUF2185 domain-containing protein [unclassified Acinetobacter]|uniref:immunity protein Imm33 domain-containing protein n=1 Tax=unclassified Acinetobacter TaxID=196816 RepID=UPI0035B7890B
MDNTEQKWHLENVRTLAKQYPYTFYVPSIEYISTLEIGDLVKLMFEDEQGQAERMWVKITAIHGEDFAGQLDNQPYEIQGLNAGDCIHFSVQHIMTSYNKVDPVPSLAQEYWDRCWTTKAILDGEAPIGLICRDEPCQDQEDRPCQDSGWQILTGDESDEYMCNPDVIRWVALGVLLNIDDSFIHLLDEKVGSAYIKNEQGEWVIDANFEFAD